MGKKPKENPAENLNFSGAEKGEIESFSNAVVRGMLHTAFEQELDFVPCLTLGVFAGLRMGSPELLSLHWKDALLDEPSEIGKQKANGCVIVGRTRAKKGSPRTVCLHDNAIAWLKAYHKRKLPQDGPQRRSNSLLANHGS